MLPVATLSWTLGVMYGLGLGASGSVGATGATGATGAVACGAVGATGLKNGPVVGCVYGLNWYGLFTEIPAWFFNAPPTIAASLGLVIGPPVNSSALDKGTP